MVEKCPFCGHELAENQMFCSKCGNQRSMPKEDEAAAEIVVEASQEPATTGEESPKRTWMQTATVIIAGLALLLSIVGLGLGAVYLGLQDRKQSVMDAANVHYDRGIAHLQAGEYELTIAEMQFVLAIDSEYPGAQEAMEEAQGHLQAYPSPTPVLGQALNETYYALVVDAYDSENWAEVVSAADQLWSVDPTFRRDQVDEMLFDAYHRSAIVLIDEGRIEEAIRLFDRALAIHPDDQGVSLQRELAVSYMNATGYWGADWERAVVEFEELYALAPDYLDVRARLFDALVSYGDHMAEQDAWCVSEQAYSRALQIVNSGEVAAKADEAAEYCRTVAQSDDSGAVIAPKGTFTGTYELLDGGSAGWVLIRGQVTDSLGKGVANTVVRIQAWNWSVTHTTDGMGQFAFDGLDQAVTYTVSIEGVESIPLDVSTEFGKITWVQFEPED